jgi:hypothetical protein
MGSRCIRHYREGHMRLRRCRITTGTLRMTLRHGMALRTAIETIPTEWSRTGFPNAITSISSALYNLELILELGDLRFEGCSGGFKLRGGESGRGRSYLVRQSGTLDAHTLLTEISLNGVYVETVHVP